jgi:tetratricopeptide (TPR) repeat protein/uncharacterized protein (UPF0147 family)
MTKRTGKAQRVILLAILALSVLAVSGGCAYYNTFYNIKKEFKAAEKQTERALLGQQAAAQGTTQPGQQGQVGGGGIPAQQYQAILESCSKLLEFYPKSRWIDDALMIMGICYYRTEEYARAERKFTELLAIFPNSKHAQMAIVWKARSLVSQGSYDLAEELLIASESKLKTPDAKAAAGRALANIYDKRERPVDAITYLEGIRSIGYDRDDKASDYLTLGRSYLALDRKDDAKQSLDQCLRTTRSPNEAFTARKLLARMAAEEGNYQLARAYLHPLQTDRRFLDRVGDTQIELANVEAVAGDPQVAVQMLEYYCASAPQGEAKARAYMLQGFVARDKLRQLEIAKAKFDSVGTMGGSRELSDSSRALASQLQRGLSALERIPVLEDSLSTLNNEQIEETHRTDTQIAASVDSVESDTTASEVDTTDEKMIAVETETTSEEKDSSVTDVAPDSMISEIIPLDTLDLQAAPDSMSLSATVPPKPKSPAEMMADSIMRVMAEADSLRMARAGQVLEDSTVIEELPDTTQIAVALPDSVTAPAAPRGPTPEEIRASRLANLTKNLINAHLEAASFYDEVLGEPDSSLYHIKAASEVPDSSAEHWRAVVQFGLALKDRDEESAESHALLESVVNSEQAPRDLRNAARDILGLPRLAEEKSPQQVELSQAETMLLNGEPIDAVLEKYMDVAAMDSHSFAGSQALQAIAYIQEYTLADYSSALTTHSAIIQLFPDSEYVSISRAKISEPDSDSVFLLSPEQLEGTFQPALELLTTDADSSGWPPEESSLMGRRFR